MSEIDFSKALASQNNAVVILEAIRNASNSVVDLKFVYLNPAAEKIHDNTLEQLDATTFLLDTPT